MVNKFKPEFGERTGAFSQICFEKGITGTKLKNPKKKGFKTQRRKSLKNAFVVPDQNRVKLF